MDMSVEQMFELILNKITAMDRRFDGLDGRMDGIEGRFDKLEIRFDGLESRFDGLEGRFDKLEARFDSSDERVDTIAIHLMELNEKVSQCATKSDLFAVKDQVFLYLDSFAKQNETFNQELAASYTRFERIEEKIGLSA